MCETLKFYATKRLIFIQISMIVNDLKKKVNNNKIKSTLLGMETEDLLLHTTEGAASPRKRRKTAAREWRPLTGLTIGGACGVLVIPSRSQHERSALGGHSSLTPPSRLQTQPGFGFLGQQDVWPFFSPSHPATPSPSSTFDF